MRVNLSPAFRAKVADLSAQGHFQNTQPVIIASTRSLAFVPPNVHFGFFIRKTTIVPSMSLPVFRTVGHLARYVETQKITANLSKADLPFYPDLWELAQAEKPLVCLTAGATGEGKVGTNIYGATHIGNGHRKTNEDALVMAKNLVIVCDGMGGHEAGEIASDMASRITYFCLQNNVPFEQAVLLAHQEIRTLHPTKNLGTTMAAIQVKGRTARIFHIGDSRVYLIRNKRVFLLTKDHSLVFDLLAMTSTNTIDFSLPLDESQIMAIEQQQTQVAPNIQNIITQAIGIPSDTPQGSLYEHRLKRGDMLLACSDGLHGPLGSLGIMEAVVGGHDLIQAALATGKASDNITFGLLRF